MSDPKAEQEKARQEVMKCEQEIQSIKAALRRLGASGGGDDTPNSLELLLVKTEGLPGAAKIHADIQLSSPVEEATVSGTFDPATAGEGATPADATVAKFRGVETQTATISISARDEDIPLGSSASQDVAPLCAVDPMDVKEEYVKELSVEILPSQPDVDPREGDEVPQLEAICTLTFRVTFKPSAKDQQEELYEMLNKTSQRKASALETLRNLSASLARSQGPSSLSDSSDAIGKPAVKSGFLNKKKKEPTKLQQFYEKTFGPNSILRKSAIIAFSARNFLIFFGASTFFHFQGQMLSLPPPA